MPGRAHFYKAFSLLIFSLLFGVFSFGQEEKPGATPALQKGNPGAKFTIEVFNDYQCPACAIFDKQLNKILAKYPNEVSIIFRNLPLTMMHPKAMPAAKAVEAAGGQGRFREMMQLIYRKQDKWSSSKSVENDFVEYAKRLGLDIEKFKADFRSQALLDRINADVERARFLNINATPTVILNGRILDFIESTELEKTIEKELSNK